MALTTDIVATYRSPRRVLRRLLASGAREERALVFLLLACLLIFIAQWPRLSREAALDGTVPLDARIGGALLGWLFMAPLALYGLAALSHLAARALGGQGNWFRARLALFWSVLAAAPLWLLNGLVAGFIGQGAALSLTGGLALAAFLVIWMLTLVEAETPDPAP